MSLIEARAILITGASSGIGAAIAEGCAGAGRTIVLSGRDAERLAAVAGRCEERGATVHTWQVDLREVEPFLAGLANLDAEHRFDAAILSAGIGDGRDGDAVVESPQTVATVADVNFRAPAAAAALLGARMAARGGGAIGIVSSVAALIPLPMAPAYAGSKAGLTTFGRALDGALRRHGVTVTVACPAFVDTPMSQRLACPKPFMHAPEEAAARILQAVRRRRRLVVFPLPYAVLVRLADWLPSSLVAALIARLPYERRS